jgi:hypothetical protein
MTRSSRVAGRHAVPLLLLHASALFAVRLPATPGRASTPVRASPYALRALRDIALVQEQLRELRGAVQPAAEQGCYLSSSLAQEIAGLSSSLGAGTGALSQSVDALSIAVGSASPVAAPPSPSSAESASALALTSGNSSAAVEAAGAPANLKTLTATASRLHQTVEEERRLLLLLEEQESGSAVRTREMFDSIDINGDGDIQFDEFQSAAATLLNVGVVEEEKVQHELRSRFDDADRDRSGSLCYTEFVSLMSGLRGDAVGPLRTALAENLQELLGVSLQMIALTLSAELGGGMASLGEAKPGRAKELAVYVDRWCEIEEQAAALIDDGEGSTADDASRRTAEASTADARAPSAAAPAAPMPASGAASAAAADGGEGAGGLKSESAESGGAVAVVEGMSAEIVYFQKIEYLLTEVGALAGALSLPNATTASEGLSRRAWRQLTFALSNFRSALGFCARGVRILARDIGEVGALLKGQLGGEAMQPKDWALVKRVSLDLISLVPYTVIMIIPLSPPGHVFAFSLLKKCFPAAVPSPFTAQRQDVYEIYSRIAFEAQSAAEETEQQPASTRPAAKAAVSGAASTAGAMGSTALKLSKATARALRKVPSWLGKRGGQAAA